MTMSRKTKADHQFELKLARNGDGMTDTEFSSPTLIAKHGRTRMNRADYIEHRMGRHHGRVAADFIRETKATKKIQSMRAAGRTRTDLV